MSFLVNQSKLKRLVFFMVLVALSTAGGYALIISTPMGLGQINDSTAYIAGARSILQGTGYSEIWLATTLEPIIHYPPLISSILAFIGLSGLDPVRGFRVLNIALYSSSIFFIGLLGKKMTGEKLAGVALALLFSLDATLLQIYANAISEPLFIFFLIISLIMLDLYVQLEKKRVVILIGILTGMAILTRYVGLALLATIAASLLVFLTNWRKRFTGIGLFFLWALPWLFAWTIRNRTLTGMATNRGAGWHPISPENINLGLKNFIAWLLRQNDMIVNDFTLSAFAISIIFGAILIWVGYFGIKYFFKPSLSLQPNPVAFTTGAFTIIYTMTLLASISFFDGTTKLQDRFLSPIFVSLLILFVVFLMWIWNTNKKKSRIAMAIFSLLFISFTATNYYQVVNKLQVDGVGYASARFQRSPVVEYIRRLPDNTKIYTNSPPAIYSATNRPSYILFLASELNDDNQAYYSQVNNDVKSKGAILVLYGINNDEIKTNAYSFLTDGLNLEIKNGTQMLYSYP